MSSRTKLGSGSLKISQCLVAFDLLAHFFNPRALCFRTSGAVSYTVEEAQVSPVRGSTDSANNPDPIIYWETFFRYAPMM